MISKQSIILLGASLFLIILSLYLTASKPLEIKTVDVEFAVGEKMGIDVNTDKLYFGRVILGGSAVRNINIENGYNFPVEVKIFATKNIADYISTEPKITISPLGNMSLPVTINIPNDAEYGDYSGKLRFEFRKDSD